MTNNRLKNKSSGGVAVMDGADKTGRDMCYDKIGRGLTGIRRCLGRLIKNCVKCLVRGHLVFRVFLVSGYGGIKRAGNGNKKERNGV